ncbi:S41 family peptidase [bacterium]|nr:S41 family peptidase [bacterium]
MRRKTAFGLILSLVVSAGYLLLSSGGASLLAYSEGLYSRIKIFTSVVETIQRAYVEERSPDELIEAAINGIVSELDPHTSYLPSDDFRSWNQNFEGYTGIGVGYEIISGKPTVMTVIQAGPADKQGIRKGDKIVAVEDQPVVGVRREDFARRLLGPAGTKVSVTVERKQWPEPRVVQLTRERVVLNSITHAMMVKPEIGYIKIDRFTGKTSTELEKVLGELESEGLKKLILDLRGNSGGYLNSAIEVTDKFIPGGHKILTTKGRLSSTFQEYYSTSAPTQKLYPLVVLIDHGAASASEIVAGAIQDLDRGLIVGKTSFGKGLVQSQYRFHDGSALLITTAKYLTPSGRAIQRDYFEKTKDEYYRDAYNEERRDPGHQTFRPRPSFKTLTGRTVFGGGGITPDVWVDNDENVLSDIVRELYFSEERYFYNYAELIAKKNPKLKKHMEWFINEYLVTDKVYQNFINYVVRADPKFSDVEFEPDKQDIKFLLKRELAYLTAGKVARFRINMQRDKQLQNAIKQLSKASSLLSIAKLQ